MTRRTIFRALIAAPFIALVAPLRSVQRYGYMDIERWWAGDFNVRGAKVLLNGRDITDGCVWFNDITGEAYCYKRDVSGQCYVDHAADQVAGHVLKGRIEVVG